MEWNEHENPNKDSEPAKHLRNFPDVNSTGKYFSRHLQTPNYVRSWNHNDSS